MQNQRLKATLLLLNALTAVTVQAEQLRYEPIRAITTIKLNTSGEPKQACQQSRGAGLKSFAAPTRNSHDESCVGVQQCNLFISACIAADAEFIPSSYDPDTGAPNSGYCQVGC